MKMQELSGVTSVLIPLYNHERFIEAALDSLLSSDCGKIELVVCDDASTDRSLAIAREWLDEHGTSFINTRVLSNAANLGITSTLNRLVEASSGEFITLLASDDMLAERAIDRQRDFLLHHPSVDFVFANCAIIDTEGHMLKPEVVTTLQAKILAFRLGILLNVMFNWSVSWARLFTRRRKFLEFGGYIEEHPIEDRWSALKIMNTRRYAYLHEVVHLYRFRGLEGHPAIGSPAARQVFHETERSLHPETTGLLYLLLWVRRLPFRTNRGKWPCRL